MLTKSILKRDSGLAFAATFFHFGVPTAAGLLALPFAARRAKSDGAELSLGFDRRELGAIAVLAICQALGFFFTNLSLQAVAVSFSHTVKACECLFTATLAWLVLGQTFSLLTYASLLPVAAGVALSAVSELQISLFGFAAAMGSNACFAMRSVLSSNVFARGRVGPIALYILLCAGALGYLALSAALTGGLLSAFSGARPLLPPMFLCGATHFSYNVLSFMILARTSPITHVVLHAVRRLIVIGASSAIAGNAITRWNWLGVDLAERGSSATPGAKRCRSPKPKTPDDARTARCRALLLFRIYWGGCVARRSPSATKQGGVLRCGSRRRRSPSPPGFPVSHGSLTVVSPERRFVSEQSAGVDDQSVGLDPKDQELAAVSPLCRRRFSCARRVIGWRSHNRQ